MPSLVSRATPDYVRTAIDRSQGRSVVMSTGGIVASEHPLASQAGAAILAQEDMPSTPPSPPTR
jgi:gamma-glutamyltranspeptidase